MRPDLKKHLIAGVLLGAAGAVHSFEIGIALATIVGFGKELVWDYLLKRGTPDRDDAIYTAAGGILGANLITIGAYFL